MPPKKPKAPNDEDLIHYRMDVLERRQEGHETEDKAKHKEFDEKIISLRLELMKVAVKLGVGGSILGAAGAYILQKFGGK